MASALTRLVRTPEGTATRFGWSFISEWRECRRRWFFHWLRPHPGKTEFTNARAVSEDTIESDNVIVTAAGQGCVPFTSGRNLSLGSIVHAGIDQWYRSEYDLTAAHDAMTENTFAPDHRYGSEQERDSLLADALVILNRHHQWFSPDGIEPEYEEWEPLRDAAGELMIEREFDVPLGYGDFRFTMRQDLIMTHVPTETIVPWEHKTCDASRQGNALREYSLSGQLTGQKMAIMSSWPTIIPQLRNPHINLIIKRAAKDKRPRQLVEMPRYEEDMELFRIGVIRTLKEMEAAVEEYEQLVSSGVPGAEAGLIVFTGEPSAITCAGAFGSPCYYSTACLHKQMMKSWFNDQTRPMVTNG